MWTLSLSSRSRQPRTPMMSSVKRYVTLSVVVLMVCQALVLN